MWGLYKMALKLKYQGKSIGRNKTQSSYKQTYYGTEAEVDTYMGSLTIGASVEGKGYLTSYEKSQMDGLIYQIEVEYTVDFDNDFSNLSSTVVGQKSAELTTRQLQMPLQNLENYLTQWNYYLAGCGDVTTPGWWQTATDTLIEPDERKTYMWIKSVGQLPTQPNEDGEYWGILEQPTKPGVEYYDKAYFVVTEKKKYGSASAAGNAVDRCINSITVHPDNTFGLGNNNWKCDDCTCAYDGRRWIVSTTYTQAPQGWDQDIYTT